MMCIGLSEIALIVADVRAAARFYRDRAGLTPETEPTDEWAWFRTGAACFYPDAVVVSRQ